VQSGNDQLGVTHRVAVGVELVDGDVLRDAVADLGERVGGVLGGWWGGWEGGDGDRGRRALSRMFACVIAPTARR